MATHPDCRECCELGRCHFCGADGRMAAEFAQDGRTFTLRLCRAHYAWAAAGKASKASFDTPGVAQIDFQFAGCVAAGSANGNEQPDEPVRQSDSFQEAARNLCVTPR